MSDRVWYFGYEFTISGNRFIDWICGDRIRLCTDLSMHYSFHDKSQAIIGVQMASAYVGTCLMPPLFGMIAEYINVSVLQIYLVVILILMIVMHERLLRKVKEVA